MTTLDPIALALRVGGIFDAIGIRHTIGGSIAASFAGEPRSTIDIDFIVALGQEQVAPLAAALTPEFYISEDAVRRAIETAGAANLIHQESQLKVDLFIAGGTPLDQQQLNRRRRVEIRPGEVLYIHPPEDILLQKLRWYDRGSGVSDRQWRDILGIIRTQGDLLDRDYAIANAPALGVEALLARAFSEAGSEAL
ncbi:MAG: hypothetical protein ABI039_10515 [Vicinamibacterales bacterium]